MSGNKDKVAFITGANRGIGFETARGLGEKGVKVILGSRDQAKGEMAAKKLKDKGIEAIAFTFDVNNVSDHRKIFEFIEKKFGKLDILVNNAAILLDSKSGDSVSLTTPSTVSQDILRKTFDANFFNLIALTQTLLPLIRKSPAGRIVNVSSSLGSLTQNSDANSHVYGFNVFAYSASKTALNAFTVLLAKELKNTKIKVNSAHPGWVKTDMGGSGAPLEISEGAKASVELSLLSDEGPTGGFYHLEETLPW